MAQQIYLSQVIGEDYKKWNKGDVILLRSPTGTGKTTLCTILAADAHRTGDKILYVTSRLAKLDEFKDETKPYCGVFLYTTYQKLEQDISYMNAKVLNEYLNCKYAFFDECHYFTDDIAIPDSNASLSEEWIRTKIRSPIKIYASATAARYFKFIREHIDIPDEHIYDIDKDYSYVTDCFVYKRGDVINILNKILSGEPAAKVLFFVNNTRRMEELFAAFGYEQADYLCSSNTSDTYLRKICNITNTQFAAFKFTKRILFATKTIDIGINIKDKDLKYIFCEMQDPATIAQCLGRKRPIDDNDTCAFYICDQDAKTLSLHNTKVSKFIKDYDAYCCCNDGFIREHKYDRNLNKGGSVFILTPGSGEIQIDYARVRKYKFDIKFYEYVKEHGFIAALKLFLDESIAARIQPYVSEKDAVIAFLRDHEDVRFYKDNKDVITNYFATIIKGKHSYGINVINDWLDNNIGDDYVKRFISKKDRARINASGDKNEYYNSNYWILS